MPRAHPLVDHSQFLSVNRLCSLVCGINTVHAGNDVFLLFPRQFRSLTWSQTIRTDDTFSDENTEIPTRYPWRDMHSNERTEAPRVWLLLSQCILRSKVVSVVHLCLGLWMHGSADPPSKIKPGTRHPMIPVSFCFPFKDSTFHIM